MGIWYKCERKAKSYFKFIIFNSGKVKIVSNISKKRVNRKTQIFKDGANFLDGIINLFGLGFIELAELSTWIIEQY